MRRKSERNKSKGSPEKKPEKATRKSTRKRGKRATSSSPERENVEEKPVEVPKTVDQSAKESAAQPATRLKIKELKTITEEEVSMKQVTSSALEPVVIGTKEGDKGQEAGEGASVWKVARADASPGEIQKLKLCRQRYPSEASDSSSSRKKSHKSYESGEGDGEEGDSAEELPRSRKRDFGRERQDDPSSSYPVQDSKEEVSHCSEILPRTTSSANFLSDDDKQNVDRLADNADHAIRLDQNNPDQKSPESVDNVQEPNSNGDDRIETKPQTEVKVEVKVEEPDKDDEQAPVKDIEKVKEDEGKQETIVKDEIIVPLATHDTPVEDVSRVEEEGEEGTKASSGDEDRIKRQNSEPATEIEVQPKRSEVRASTRTLRRKHRNKYHESSDSDTPESEDEPSEKKSDESKSGKEQAKEAEREKSRSPSPENRLSFSTEDSKEEKIVGSNEIDERINDSENKPKDDTIVNSRPADYKPPKVNLKRSFAARLVEAEEVVKKDDVDKNGEIEVSLQIKENHAAVDETEGKNLPRKRRWGTTVTVEATPAFSVSTDSLKVLVPGAKPLSITEVRLSKDDDEEKSRRKEREKRHSVDKDAEDQISRDGVSNSKNENPKKGDLKHDNHIGAKRKISILKETPRVKSPSPPSAKATNILHIKNLVRPFTLNQIKELLSRTGTIVENGFWIDGIKSKCYVVYSNEDQAFETRQALHGISWPVSNPKRLQVEYATKEDMDLAREQSKDQPITRKAEAPVAGDNWQQVWTRDDKQNVAKVTTVREWDLGKEDGTQGKEKEREKKDLDKKRRQRSRSPALEPHLPPPARKFKKKEDEPPPAKLLDDLFKKTKAIPCIYWLPLTNEQIVVKEEMRRQHMAEHARRLEEMKRAERSRDPAARRRRSPRK